MNTDLKQAILKGTSHINSLYEVLYSKKLLQERASQKDLSVKVFRSFLENVPALIEAPTGTGKTLAYLIGALVYRLNFEKNTPLIFSTATKALQDQLVSKDLKTLIEAGLLAKKEVQLTKGKNNYICLKSAKNTEAILEELLDDPEKYAPDYVFEIDFYRLSQMLKEYENSSWNGDFDTYPDILPGPTRHLAVDGDKCTYKKCAHYDQCAYFKVREESQSAAVIVTNHDLLLRESMFASEAKLNPDSTKSKKFNVVFDEAHHLPQKALKMSTIEINLQNLREKLKFLYGFSNFGKKLTSENVPPVSVFVGWPLIEDKVLLDLESDFEEFLQKIEALDFDSNNQKIFDTSFVEFPDTKQLSRNLVSSKNSLNQAKSVFTSYNESMYSKEQNTIIKEYFDRAFELFKALDEIICVLDKVSMKKATDVVWVYKKDTGFKETFYLSSAPLFSKPFLEATIWSSFGLIKTPLFLSATLSDTSGFEKIKEELGCPSKTREAKIPSVFDYSKSTLEIVPMKFSPSQKERVLFLDELRAKLPSFIDPSEGTLIIFNSWSQLNSFSSELKLKFGSNTVKVQGEKQVPLLVSDHKKDIDEGKGSILLGVATLSEGLDLPGKYCTHVIIPVLPFSVPTDPVEQRLQEQLGDTYFDKKSLPEATLRLIQSVGRLVRRESDFGKVTILDKRLKTTKYGKKMLEKLPAFKLI